MASVPPPMDIKEEVKCPICKDYLTGPVTLDCGHNFCKGCISQYCEMWEGHGSLRCPLCKAKMKRRNFQTNRQLANIVENLKCLPFCPEKEHLCVKHKEKLNLFCKEDQELVCVICERSPEHRSHTVLLLEEAAKQCKEQLCSSLEILRQERQRILETKTGTEIECRDLLEQIIEKKTRTVDVFHKVHQFLEERKTILISQLEELEKKIVIRKEEHMARLEGKLSSLEDLLQQMEEKCQQPTSELLQDIRTTLERYEKKEEFENPVAFPPELSCRIWGVYDVKLLLEGVKNQFMSHEFPARANVTLDPERAHPKLILSEDRKSVRWGYRHQALPEDPEKFNILPCVLGSEEFIAGRHFWEVTVGREGTWAVGVARKSVRREGWFDLGWFGISTEEGFWAVGKWKGKYRVFNPTENIPQYPLTYRQELKRIRVTLNCDEGEVSFSDADSGVHLYTHSEAFFRGETLLPFFCVFENAHLSLSL